MTETELLSAAADARTRAYAHYSGFAVGAALLGKSGRTYMGGNVENISAGLTICAERSCVAAAVQAGETHFQLLAIVTDSKEPAVPCGACRQVLAEFAPDLRIISAAREGRQAEYSLGELLPRPRQGILEKFHVEHV